MPSILALKALNSVHRALLRVSGGRVGWTTARMPVLELSTRGRRSGRPHTVVLTSPVQLGDTLVVVASRGGDDRPPAWLLNLRAQPEVRVRTRGGTWRVMHARVAAPQERAALWPRITARYGGYARYQRRTRREIAVVLLEPTG